MTKEESDRMDGKFRRDIREAYDRIAPHFSETREIPWPEVATFLQDRSGSVGLDIGCGNGRHLDLLERTVDRAIGIDISRELLYIAARGEGNVTASPNVVQGDALTLPIDSECADICLYIATIHHILDRTERIASLNELNRVLTGDGRALISAWSVDHERFDDYPNESFESDIDWTMPSGEVVARHFHITDERTFRNELDASELEPIEVFPSSGNWYAIVRKT